MARTKLRCPVKGCLRLRYDGMFTCIGHWICLPLDMRRELVRLDHITSPRFGPLRREAIRLAAQLENAEVMNVFDGGSRGWKAPQPTTLF